MGCTCKCHLLPCPAKGEAEAQVTCGAQVAQQEAELDEAYDTLELELRATPCEDSNEVRAPNLIT